MSKYPRIIILDPAEVRARLGVIWHHSRKQSAQRQGSVRGCGRPLRKRIEEVFGWIKTVAGQAKTRFRGLERVDLAFTFVAAAYNLVRLPKLLAGSA
jgi:hypothetical protein